MKNKEESKVEKSNRLELENKENAILEKTITEYNKYKNKTINKFRKRKKRKIIFSLLLLFLILFVICGSIALYIYSLVKDDVHDAIKLGYEKIETLDVDTFHTKYNSVLLDSQGNVLKEFEGREYIYGDYKDLNKNLLDATVAIEDERFFEHKGIDIKSLARAGYYTIVKHQVQGGSTITVQLAKNIFMSEVMTQKSIYRKITEWVIAQELEKRYSKEEILEFYVNNINYGNGCYSAESAAQYYFQKSTKDLTLAECALIAGIPNNPSLYNPISQKDNSIKRRNIILDKMYDLEYITEKEWKKAKKEPLNLNQKEVYIDNSVSGYAETFAMHKATQELMKTKGFLFKYTFKDDEERAWYEENYNTFYEECYQQLISGGYKISTSIDNEKQAQLQAVIDSKMARFTETQEDGLYSKQASATVIDNSTGLVVAIVGGRSQENNIYNRAAFSARQPGSSIKPLISYAPAYERGYYPEMEAVDEQIENGPKNYYSGFIGSTSFRYATEISINTIPFKLTRDIGVANCMKYLTNMHFANLTNEDYLSPVVAVGGFTKGITNVEMTSGFATLANNGKFIEPTNVTEIRKISNDSVIYENKHTKTTVYNSGAAFLTTNTLEGVLQTDYGTAHDVRLSYPYQAGKTGTTNESKDLWMCGYTPYYSMSVWVGDDYPKYQSYINEHKEIWHDYMEYLHQGLEVKGWQMPTTVYNDNGVLKVKLDTRLEDLKKKRLNLEAQRKNKELEEQKDRLAELDYRLVHGLTEEEEMSREKVAETLISSLEDIQYTSLKQKEKIHKLYVQIEAALEKVKRASAYNKLNKRYQEKKQELDELEYQFELKEKAEKDLKEAKEQMGSYIYKISNYININDYREEDRSGLKRIIEEATEAMQKAISVSELDTILNTATHKLDSYKTSAQLDYEEANTLAYAKESAISGLNIYVKQKDYKEQDWKNIENIISKAVSDINGITSYNNISQIDTIVQNAKTKIDSIPKKPQSESSSSTKPSDTTESSSETESHSETTNSE